MLQGGPTLAEQITHGYQLVTQQSPDPETIQILTDLHQTLLKQSDKKTANTILANTILNLDAALTK